MPDGAETLSGKTEIGEKNNWTHNEKEKKYLGY